MHAPGLNRAYSFGYVDPNGPAKWGSLSPKFTECSKGKHQAPVDIVKDEVVHKKSLKPLIRDYSPVNATMVNNGFNIEVCSFFFPKTTDCMHLLFGKI